MSGFVYTALSDLLTLYLHVCVLFASELCNLGLEFDYGYVLTSSSFYSVKRSSVYACAGMCKSMRLCKSINFNLEEKMCYLNIQNAKRERQALLVEDPFFVYSDKSRWSKKIAGPCANVWCKISKPCTVGRSGQARCGTLFFQDFDANIEYEYVSVNKTWNDAKGYCEMRGSHLAKVDTVEKVYFLEGIANITDLNETEIFLGGSVKDYAGDWRWQDGSSFQNVDFIVGELTGNEGTCLSVTFSVGWNDPNCLIKRPFICEKMM
ncbi:C-type lectin domain family 6 member A-like [Haliotis asinina]|uniref:C-type lectin domain family 6 member A-like n=1 Tax=Haliotis asinina TaxID=109174 RepID=UPI003531C555